HPILSSKIFCNSAARQGTSRTPFCWNPYSSSACFSNFKNNGLFSQCNSTINLFGSSSEFTDNTAKCPSLTSFGTTSLFLNFLIISLMYLSPYSQDNFVRSMCLGIEARRFNRFERIH
uniref:Uncharacterized protein n=1 Tax=Solanum lycopersicum TaxID=4081 RepID=A0A3Q7ILX6_SOLLC